jgi:hypothetical protein
MAVCRIGEWKVSRNYSIPNSHSDGTIANVGVETDLIRPPTLTLPELPEHLLQMFLVSEIRMSSAVVCLLWPSMPWIHTRRPRAPAHLV